MQSACVCMLSQMLSLQACGCKHGCCKHVKGQHGSTHQVVTTVLHPRYSHVVPKCLEDSPTAKWWGEYYAAGGKQSDLVVHIEKGGDYDGLAVAWGINNKKATAEECAAQCLEHMPTKGTGAAATQAFIFVASLHATLLLGQSTVLLSTIYRSHIDYGWHC